MNYLFIELLTANDEGIERESEREQTSKIVPYLPHTHTDAAHSLEGTSHNFR